MEKYVIHGGKPLHGEVTISGAKNAAVAIVPAALMVDGPCIIENVPDIVDVKLQFEILKEMGVKVTQLDATTFQTENNGVELESEAMFRRMRRLRASYYFIGAELGRYGRAKVAMPGGCNFGGIRPIDQHIMGFEKLGAFVRVDNDGYITVIAPEGLKGRHIYFDVVTVGATMNVMLAAVFAKGQTVMENVAKEPHIVDLANFLNQMGADIRGAGTDKITITGVERLHGTTITAWDLRAGAAMIVAALCADGQTQVRRLRYIDRGYANLETKLRALGADIVRVPDPDSVGY